MRIVMINILLTVTFSGQQNLTGKDIILSVSRKLTKLLLSGAYAQLVTDENGVNIKYIESGGDKVMYEYTVPPRF